MYRLGMITLASAGTAFLLLISIPNAGAKPAGKGGGGSTCTPSSAVVTIDDTYTDPTTLQQFTSAIASDGLGEYRDGVDGVSVIIHDCPNGTGDLTLNAGSGSRKKAATRSIKFNFTDRVDLTNPLTPDWLSAPLLISGININQITNNSLGNTFTTGGGGGGFPNPNYYLRFDNPQRDTTGASIYANSPCDTALINVIHTPATSLAAEKWEVWSDASIPSICSGVFPNPVQIGAVVDSRTSWSSVGQARLPFHLIIQKLKKP